jgi:hypothetical protein
MAICRRRTVPYAGVFDPTHRFVTSWILPPGVLFGIRTLLAVYAFTTLFTIFGWNGSHGNSAASRHSFSFFTVLTYWGLAFYYAFSAAHTGSYWLTGTSFLSRWPKPLQTAHSMFYSTIVVYPWIVTSKSKLSSTLEVEGGIYECNCLSNNVYGIGLHLGNPIQRLGLIFP